MTNKDLYRARSDVDTDMVLDAQPAPKRSRPVWARAVAIAACACLTVGVLATLPFISKWAAPDTPDVPGETVTPEQTEQQTEVPTAGQVIGDPDREPIFLYMPSMNATNQGIADQFKPSSDYGVYTALSTQTFDELSNAKIQPSFSTQAFEYVESVCYLKNDTSNEYGSFYSIFDVYRNGEDEIKCLHGTNKIAFYFTPYEQSTSSLTISESSAKSIAEDFILQIISQQQFDHFTYLDTSTDALGRYMVCYVRYISDYATDETIAVWVDTNGHVSGYNGYSVGKYDSLTEQLNNEKLDASYKLLLSKIASLNLPIERYDAPIITTSTDGKLFLQVNVHYAGNSGFAFADSLLISIE